MFRYILIFFFFLISAFEADSQVNVPDPDTLYSEENEVTDEVTAANIDTGIYIRSFTIDPDSVRFLKNKKQFSYLGNLDSLLKEAQKEIQKTQAIPASRTNSRNIFDSPILQSILWILAGCFVIYVIYRLFLTRGVFDRSARKAVVEETLSPDQEFLRDDFTTLYHRSKTEGDLRSATRFLFLQTLKDLESRSEIEFSLDKTNSRYISELAPGKRESFAWLVMNYEYTWYGKLMPSPERFSLIESKFKEFGRKD